MERRTSHHHAKDLFNSFSVLCNVLPYFGYLDQSYKMMIQLNKNSNSRWRDYEESFCLSLLDDRRRRLTLCFSYSDKLLNWKLKDIVKLFREYPILYKIFKMPYLNIISNEDLDCLLSFCQDINNKYLRFTTINFDHIKLETDFHSRYSALLKEQELDKESESLHTYISSKGFFLDMNSVADQNIIASSVPKTTCCIMLSKESTITDEKMKKIPKEMRSSIRNLKINYIKDVTSYIDFCSQNSKILDWFDQIDDIKFSVTTVTEA